MIWYEDMKELGGIFSS